MFAVHDKTQLYTNVHNCTHLEMCAVVTQGGVVQERTAYQYLYIEIRVLQKGGRISTELFDCKPTPWTVSRQFTLAGTRGTTELVHKN